MFHKMPDVITKTFSNNNSHRVNNRHSPHSPHNATKLSYAFLPEVHRLFPHSFCFARGGQLERFTIGLPGSRRSDFPGASRQNAIVNFSMPGKFLPAPHNADVIFFLALFLYTLYIATEKPALRREMALVCPGPGGY